MNSLVLLVLLVQRHLRVQLAHLHQVCVISPHRLRTSAVLLSCRVQQSALCLTAHVTWLMCPQCTCHESSHQQCAGKCVSTIMICVGALDIKEEKDAAAAPAPTQADSKPEAAPPAAEQAAHDQEAGAAKTEDEDQETYERDATELLGAFKDEEKPQSVSEAHDAEALMKQFMLDMKAVDRDNEVNRIIWAFKLNPFEKMGLRFTATASDVKTAYRCAQAATNVCLAHLSASCVS